ncbi:MAG: amidohydrolase family protein [Armatimonadetes bacterium]|nr:amidohydrolase family protein [Armatimonadota bacterium]MDW8122053.1 amidohydrolase family protein [Armatimonadota bacterium]
MNFLVQADWVLPVTRPPIVDGALLIANGRIVAVGLAKDLLSSHSGSVPQIHFPRSVVTPGLVNPHTHLDNSLLPYRLKGYRGFEEWITLMADAVRRQTDQERAQAVLKGIQSLLKAGVTCVGDISRDGTSFDILTRYRFKGVVFRELICLTKEQMTNRLKDLEHWCQGQRTLVRGLAPHSPYTVIPEALRQASLLSRSRRLPLSFHLAESPMERRFLKGSSQGLTGLQTLLKSLPSPTSPVDYADRFGLLTPQTLLIHCVQLTESDIRLLAQRRSWVVHCPRSNQNLQVGMMPLSHFRTAGGRFCLATDGLASVPSLDPKDEVAFAVALSRNRPSQYPALAPHQWLSLITLKAAQALGWGNRVGSLEPGKDADLAVFTSSVAIADPYELLFSSCPATAVFVDGQPIYLSEDGQERVKSSLNHLFSPHRRPTEQIFGNEREEIFLSPTTG